MKTNISSHCDFSGHLEIRVIREHASEPIDPSLSIHINGNPKGLTSLANLLLELANLDQNKIDKKELPKGARSHHHFSPNVHLSQSSNETTIGRLDIKGTDTFPNWYLEENGQNIISK